MYRYVLHFALWIVAIPWLACFTWLWLLINPPALGVSLAPLFPAGLGALFAVITYLPITAPLSAIACVIYGHTPGLAQNRRFQMGFPVFTGLLGWVCAHLTGSSFATDTGNDSLGVVIGFLAGLALGVLTAYIWRTPPKQQHGPSVGLHLNM
jgi:hypothetical protein